jgi:hypothetical protein
MCAALGDSEDFSGLLSRELGGWASVRCLLDPT